MMNATHSRKNVTIGGHRTSLCLEMEIWDALAEACRREGLTVHQLCSLIDERRLGNSRTSAVRAFVVNYFRDAATESGHLVAGHGQHADAPPIRRRVAEASLIDARRRLLSAPYFERRQQRDRRREAGPAAAQDRRLGDRRDSLHAIAT